MKVATAEGAPPPSNEEEKTMPECDPDVLMKKIQKMYETLPQGWRKGEPNKAGAAPFVHEDGRVSWKHPGRAEMQKVIQEATGTVDCQPAIKEEQKSLVKRYKMMLRHGVPPAAVEQRAKVEGVDPALIFAKDVDDKKESPKRSRRTWKATTKFVGNKPHSLKKFQRMIKAGIPMKAVQQAADLEGVDISELTAKAANGGESEEGTTTPAEARAVVEKKKDHGPFTPQHNNNTIVFPKGTDLTRLVQKLVQTIQKRATATTDLTVDQRVLYHALGSLKGVQHSRNVYNSTCDETQQSILELRSKRKPYLELASSLGMSPPTDWKAHVDIAGLDELISYVEGVYKEELAAVQAMMQVGTYDFDSLAQLYQPGTRVYASNAFAGGVGMMCEVVWNRYEQGKTLFGVSKTFKVCFQFVVAVGQHFTLAECVEGMDSFTGKRQISALSFIPVAIYNNDELMQLHVQLSARGRLYSKVATRHHYMEYDKGSFYAKGRTTGNGSNASPTGGRLMVDTQGAYEAGHSIGTGYDPMVMGIKYKYKEYLLYQRAQKDSTTNDSSGMVVFDQVPEDYLTMTWPAVVGFSFQNKAWGDVLVDGLSEIEFQEDVFDKIVLPPARKRMVKALVKHSSGGSFHDVVRGKGEGSVFLLWGAPGTGKTLTAEAICEMLHKPLYTVSLGQLGSSAAELETNLNAILTLCARWDALILLDEADIFLEKRSSKGSLERNAMVSVMLRLVEYFKGVLFLTSNRIDSLDPAFKTRITLALRYEALDEAARNQIWINLLKTSGYGKAVQDGVINTKSLAKHVLNGREIKNSIRLAMALAEEDGEPLSQKFLLETVDILNEFNQQMVAGNDEWEKEETPNVVMVKQKQQSKDNNNDNKSVSYKSVSC